MVEAIAEQSIVPDQRPPQPAGIGVEQQLVRIEPVTGIRRIRSMNPIAVKAPRPDAGEIAVPDLVCELRQRDPLLVPAAIVEEAKLDLRGIRREQGEVRPLPVPGRPQRVGQAGPNAEFIGCHVDALKAHTRTERLET